MSVRVASRGGVWGYLFSSTPYRSASRTKSASFRCKTLDSVLSFFLMDLLLAFSAGFVMALLLVLLFVWLFITKVNVLAKANIVYKMPNPLPRPGKGPRPPDPWDDESLDEDDKELLKSHE